MFVMWEYVCRRRRRRRRDQQTNQNSSVGLRLLVALTATLVLIALNFHAGTLTAYLQKCAASRFLAPLAALWGR